MGGFDGLNYAVRAFIFCWHCGIPTGRSQRTMDTRFMKGFSGVVCMYLAILVMWRWGSCRWGVIGFYSFFRALNEGGVAEGLRHDEYGESLSPTVWMIISSFQLLDFCDSTIRNRTLTCSGPLAALFPIGKWIPSSHCGCHAEMLPLDLKLSVRFRYVLTWVS